MNNILDQNDKLDMLLTEMRRMDENNLRESRRWRVIMAVCVMFYALLLIANPNGFILTEVICFYGLFMLHHFNVQKLRKKDFSLSVKQELMNTRKRFGFFRPVTLIAAVLAAPIIYGGIDVMFSRYIHASVFVYGDNFIVPIVFVLFFALVLLAAYLVWRNRYAEIQKKIDQSLEELSEP